MKTIACLIILSPCLLFAQLYPKEQTNAVEATPALSLGATNAGPVVHPPETIMPQGNPLTLLIVLGVPALIALLKMEIPKLPGWSLPIIAPLMGALADYLIHLAGGPGAGAVLGAALGSAGVGIREIYSQLQQKAADVKAARSVDVKATAPVVVAPVPPPAPPAPPAPPNP